MDTTTAAATPTRRLVIDTNIWLDMLVFDEPSTRRLASMVVMAPVGPVDPVSTDERGDAGETADPRSAQMNASAPWQAIATSAMRAELADVIGRPVFRLTPTDQHGVLQRFDASTQTLAPAPDCRLACRDPDDRKFLDLAVRERCTLLSRDKALLAARRHALRRFGIAIGTVADFYRTLPFQMP